MANDEATEPSPETNETETVGDPEGTIQTQPVSDNPVGDEGTTGEQELENVGEGISRIKEALREAAQGDQMKNVAKEMITTTKGILSRLIGYGLELPEEKRTFKEAIVAIKNQEYIKGCQLTLRTKSRLERAQQNYINKSLSRPQEFLKNVEICDLFTVEGKEKMQESLNGIKEIFDAREYVTAFKKMNEYLVEETNIKIRLQKGEQFQVLREKVDGLLASAEVISVDTTEETETLARIGTLMDERNVEEALPLLEDVCCKIEKKIDLTIVDNARDALRKAVELTKENEEIIDIMDIKTRLENARSKFKAEEYKACCDISSEAIRLIEDARGDRQIQEINDFLENIQKIVEANEEMGADVFKSEAYLYKARYVFEKGNFTYAIELGKEAEKSAKTARLDFYRQNVTSILEESTDLLSEASGFELDVSEIAAGFESARTGLKKEELEEGNAVAADNMNRLKEMIHLKLQDIIGAEFPSLQMVMETANSIEADVSEESEELRSIEELKKEGKYRIAIKKVEDLKRSVNNKIRIRNKELNAITIEGALKELAELQKATGKDFPEMEEHINLATNTLETEDYDALNDIIAKFNTAKEKQYELFRQEQYQDEITQLEEMIREMNALGIELPDDLVANLNELKKKEG